MRTDMNTYVAFAAALVLTACAPKPQLFAEAAAPPRPAVEVAAGDHMTINGRAIVLADAETPQPGSAAGCQAEAMAAAQTTQVVRDMLANAQRIDLGPAKDGGRTLVHVDGLDLGLTLVSQRLAVRREATPMDWCASIRPWGETASRGAQDPAS